MSGFTELHFQNRILERRMPDRRPGRTGAGQKQGGLPGKREPARQRRDAAESTVSGRGAAQRRTAGKAEPSAPDELFIPAGGSFAEDGSSGGPGYSYLKSTLRVFFSNRVSAAVLIFLMLLIVFTFLQPLLPGQKSPTEIFINPETGTQYRNVRPNAEFWFGTNSIGQDLWSRLWFGTRISLFIGLCTAAVTAAAGIALGCIWGCARRWDKLFTEIYNVFDNIPYTILRMLLIYILRPGLPAMSFVMSLTGWVGMAKYIRSLILIYRDREFNMASRCLGSSGIRIVLRNLLPQLIPVIMLNTALAIPNAIGSEVFLTYIGLGLPVSVPSLGTLVNEGRSVVLAPAQRYQLFFPALAVSALTIAFYALGNAFADASDPRNHR